jgi:hypothetical protein
MNGRTKVYTRHRRLRMDKMLDEEIEHYLLGKNLSFSAATRRLWLAEIQKQSD